jgi:hypothetical protein
LSISGNFSKRGFKFVPNLEYWAWKFHAHLTSYLLRYRSTECKLVIRSVYYIANEVNVFLESFSK